MAGTLGCKWLGWPRVPTSLTSMLVQKGVSQRDGNWRWEQLAKPPRGTGVSRKAPGALWLHMGHRGARSPNISASSVYFWLPG